MNRILLLLVVIGIWFPSADVSAKEPDVAAAKAALRKACEFFFEEVGVGGGFVWQYSGDLALSEGEAKTAGTTTIWVQPPGTPTIGEAFLDAYAATGDKFYLDAANKAGQILATGQMRTGGWYYSIETNPEKQGAFAYRHIKPAKKQLTRTTVDDNTTQGALHFLIRLDEANKQNLPAIHNAATFGLDALIAAQRPNGGWPQNWTEYPTPVSKETFPVIKASYPNEWSRKWLNDWTGKYFLNDDVTADLIDLFLLAHTVYGDKKYLAAAEKGGDFLIMAQMPDPQPAWAQQYNEHMQPVWDRKFEPPAISGGESQQVITTLMQLYRETGEEKYLEPIPAALAYLKKSQSPDGKLARFYELKTNRPLYFTKDYQLTYDAGDVPTHYSFTIESKLDSLSKEYERYSTKTLDQLKAGEAKKQASYSEAEVAAAIASMDDRGAWVEKGTTKNFPKIKNASGVIRSQTFADNVRQLSNYIAAQAKE
ncbi:pectate lyase [Blastopirellula sp. JC732]|uniref:Pectate lyase n=1 Tax=Blastopirellula sediminis TaxID=2894196 RepID=A0A9X1MMD7_9BACT|nr:pectate lyase [Blastopirellula sediminis]MCC9609079.1 pectate lyase [Blastopirellula sediminis]MCC9628144.1 pectate lyase [Blastopirellula sediminis]